MSTFFEIQGFKVEVTKKKVKNLNLRVYPSEGRVALSCPFRTKKSVIKAFLNEKKNWIDKQLNKGRREHKRPVPKFITGEKIMLWGQEIYLVVHKTTRKQRVKRDENKRVHLYVRNGDTKVKREKIMREWYRENLRKAIPGLINKWEPVMGVNVCEFGVKKMKTRWGTCNIRDKRIWLNLELAKLNPVCLEYIVVHEMVHLLERLHNKRFYSYMDQFLPGWEKTDKLLKSYQF